MSSNNKGISSGSKGFLSSSQNTSGSMKRRNILCKIFIFGLCSGIFFGLPTFKHMIAVGTGFTAITACTGRFISQRNDKDLIKHELSGLPSLVVDFSVNVNNKSVKAFPRYLGYDFAKMVGFPVKDAFYIDDVIGCKMTLTGVYLLIYLSYLLSYLSIYLSIYLCI
jgi:hypothetical protein